MMPLTLIAVGDIMLGEQPLCESFGVKSVLRREGPAFFFEQVAPLLAEGDVVFGNLECSMNSDDADQSQVAPFFCADGAAVGGLKAAGFTVLSIANNHVMENGRERFIETVKTLRRHGITPTGIPGQIPVLDVNGTRVAFLAYSMIEDRIADPCYNKVQSEESIIAEIRAVRPDADIVVVSLHWGFEYVPFPSPDQIRIGRTLVDAGADIILGGHPHVVQSFEMYHGRPILYSLGNFIFDQTFVRETRDSVVARITIGESADRIGVEFTPIRINRRHYYPELVPSPEKDRMLALIDETRSMVEGTSVTAYEERLGDYNEHYRKYKRPALRSMKMQFVLHIYRYSLPTFNMIIKSYVVRRVGEPK